MSCEIELTTSERLILLQQLQILKILDPDNRARYRLEERILVGGYKLFYDEIATLSEEQPEETGLEVLKTLQMFRLINDCKEKLVENDVEMSVEVQRLEFDGYDGNNESEYLAAANLILDSAPDSIEEGNSSVSLGRFSEMADMPRDSHCPVRHLYERMVEEFEKMGQNISSVEDLQRIADAKKGVSS